MSDNPQSFFNGILGAYRNLIVSVSAGVAIYGFSRSFPKKQSRDTMKKLSLLVYISALFIILNTVLLLRKYLNSMTDEEIQKLPKYIDLKKWRIYEYIGWFLVFIVVVVVFLSSKEYVIKIFNKSK